MRKIQSKKRYLLAFIIGTAIFLLGFGITYSISYLEFQRVAGLQGPISYAIFEEKLRYTYFNENLCSEDSFLDVSQELAFQGRIIDDLERKLGKNNENILFRKKFYSLIEIEHLDFVETINNECGKSINTILFFYSNEENDLRTSEEVGDILSVIASKDPSVRIYSFDINLDSKVVELLKQEHGVEKSPTVVINRETMIEGPKTSQEIETYLY